jgi:glycosyltransferase involved in cell wall biosynthesis
MNKSDPISTKIPLLSIIIAVYNDWMPLEQCLRSLAEQANPPSLEVIVVDDGSREPAPEFILKWISSYPLTVLREAHKGISTARNSGIRISRGQVLLFVDADCRLQPDCLESLSSTITYFPQHYCFQLRLVGEYSGLVGKTEALRLITIQSHTLKRDGRIQYLNTAGFAILRSRVDPEKGLFDPAALRAEDTLLLANLMQSGELPLFVPNAIIQHAPALSITEFFLKVMRSAYIQAKTYRIIASMGVRLRVSNCERLSMVASMWKTAGQPSIGRSAWFMVTARQTVKLIVSFLYRCLH